MLKYIKIFNILVGVILILGFTFVAFTLYQRSKQKNPIPENKSVSLGAPGCQISGSTASGPRVFITLHGDGDCNRIVVLDTHSLSEISVIRP